MRRRIRNLVDFWYLIGVALVVTVVVLTCVLYVGDSHLHEQQQLTTQNQAVMLLRESVDDVPAREIALARVVDTLPGPVHARWPVLSNIVMSQPLATFRGK
jgi:hypothetical protein